MDWNIWLQILVIVLIMVGGLAIFRHRVVDRMVDYEHRMTRIETELGLVSKEDAARKQ